MPLLYGEGSQRAFLRLQQEILRHSNDQSIFVWSIPKRHNLGQRVINSLASSPSFFRFSSRISPSRAPGDNNNRSVTNQGITLKVLANPSRSCIILKCHRVGGHALPYFTVKRLRSGSDEYVRTSREIGEFEPSELPEGVDTLEFYRENRTNYLAIARLPPSSSGYYIKQCCLGDSYDDPMSIKISPFASEVSGVIFSFHHRKKSHTPSFVALFCFGDLAQPNSVGMENDFIGVYNDTGEQTMEEFYELFHEWFGKREAGELPSAAKLETTDGLDVWRLQDGQLVHVSVSRHLNPVLGYAGCVRILAGGSWEVDIKPFADWGPFERGE